MHADVAATYALIYRFLKQQAHAKAADAVKKAAEPFVVDSELENGPPLEDIVKKWRTTMTTNSDAGSSSGASESSDASDSDQSSDSSADESEDASDSTSEDDTSDCSDGADSQRKPVERDTSVTLSSAGENGQGTANESCQTTKKAAKVVGDATKHESTASESGSTSDSSDGLDAETSNSSDSSDSDSSDSGENELPARNRTETTKAKSESPSESSSESEDESDSEPDRGGEKCKASQDKDAASTSESSSESDESDSEAQQDVHVTKKRKVSNDKAVGVQPATGSTLKKEKLPPKAKERFQRVKVQSIASELLLDNGYRAKGGVTNDYGERAHRDLIVTRGAGFRKEKNKKKRGSYRGGEITLESHSIKFDF